MKIFNLTSLTRLFYLLTGAGVFLFLTNCGSKFDPLYLPGLVVNATATPISCSVSSSPFGGGSGTASSPYRVCSRAHLAAISGTYLSKYFTQYSDIDLGGAGSPWTPIGTSIAPFAGTYDGNSKTISGLYRNDVLNVIGLFGYGDGLAVKNLTLSSVNLTGLLGAGLVGYVSSSATIENCQVSGTITANDKVGGFVGYSNDAALTIQSSSSSASINSTAPTLAAGGAGGLAGFLEQNSNTARIRYSSASGAVTDVSSGGSAGGLVGMIAFNNAIIEYSSASGTISGYWAGGLLGSSGDGGFIIRYSYATGSVTGDDAGGLAGYVDGNSTYIHSYATGYIDGNNVGGLVSTDGGPLLVTACYWDTQTSGLGTSAVGTGRTTAQMKDYTNFVGWDFSAIWNGATYGGSAAVYPFLR